MLYRASSVGCSRLPVHVADISCQKFAPRLAHNPSSFGSYPPVSLYRLDHESHLTGLPFDTDENADDDDDDVPDAPAPEPAFIRRLIERFSRLGHNVHDRDFEVALRTWFIDHVNMRRCSAFRILQLVGPPHLWEQQFTSLWVDLLSPNEWFELNVVTARPTKASKVQFCRTGCYHHPILAHGPVSRLSHGLPCHWK